MTDESRVPLFNYNEVTNEIEYGDVSVRTGANRVDVKGSTGEVLHNGVAIGGGGSASAPYALQLPVVRCGIGVTGDPDEFGQTVNRPLGPFLIDAGEGASNGGPPLLMTVNMTSVLNYEYIFPTLTVSLNIGGNDFYCSSGYNNNHVKGMSIGRRTNYDVGTGIHTYTFVIDFGALWETHSEATTLVLVTVDGSTVTGALPVAEPPT